MDSSQYNPSYGQWNLPYSSHPSPSALLPPPPPLPHPPRQSHPESPNLYIRSSQSRDQGHDYHHYSHRQWNLPYSSHPSPSALLPPPPPLPHPPRQSHPEASVKELLDRFPLPVIFNALQTDPDIPAFEKTLVTCLERVFKTKYGASLIPQYMPVLQAGLKADSAAVKTLACKTVTFLLENCDANDVSPVQLVVSNGIYPLLLDYIIKSDDDVAHAASETIKSLARFPDALSVIFPAETNDATHLGNLAGRCSSLARVRVLALIVKLFSISRDVASAVKNSGLLDLLEAEMKGTKDTRVISNVLELYYELMEPEHSSEFAPQTSLIQLLCSIISDKSTETFVKIRAMMISGRLLSRDNIYDAVEEACVKALISAVDGSLETPEMDASQGRMDTGQRRMDTGQGRIDAGRSRVDPSPGRNYQYDYNHSSRDSSGVSINRGLDGNTRSRDEYRSPGYVRKESGATRIEGNYQHRGQLKPKPESHTYFRGLEERNRGLSSSAGYSSERYGVTVSRDMNRSSASHEGARNQRWGEAHSGGRKKDDYYHSEIEQHFDRGRREASNESGRAPRKQMQKKSALLRLETPRSHQNGRENVWSRHHSNYSGKRFKNQLVRTSESRVNHSPDDALHSRPAATMVPERSSSSAFSYSAVTRPYKHSKFSLVWTQNDPKSRMPVSHMRYQRILPQLVPWKRVTYWRRLMNSVSTMRNGSFSNISQKLSMMRKRHTVYTRSTNGYSLRKSKVLSVGGSHLKWSKSIERDSRKANEEATLAVAANSKKESEKHSGQSNTRTTSRSHLARERVFRFGSLRYKMDSSRRTLQRISDVDSPCSGLSENGKGAKIPFIQNRLVIGNEEYVRVGNGNQLVRDPKKRTRALAKEKVRWSLHNARLRSAKKKKYCQFFTRFGKCNKDDGKCPYVHDPSKIAVCTKFLNGLCVNANCKLTHKVIPERMPDCSYFLQGLCNNEACPYRHVHVNPSAAICDGFLKGHCSDGDECRKKHSYICPVFEATGSCSQGSKCKLHHPKNQSKGRKRKRPSEPSQKNARGRYFGSLQKGLSEAEPMVLDGSSTDSEAFGMEGLDFIILGAATEYESGDNNDTAIEQSNEEPVSIYNLIRPVALMQ